MINDQYRLGFATHISVSMALLLETVKSASNVSVMVVMECRSERFAMQSNDTDDMQSNADDEVAIV